MATRIWTPIETDGSKPTGRLASALLIGDDELDAIYEHHVMPYDGYHAYVLIEDEWMKIGGAAEPGPYPVLERGLFGTDEADHAVNKPFNILNAPDTIREIAREEIDDVAVGEIRDSFADKPLGALGDADSGQTYYSTGIAPLTVQASPTDGRKVLTHSLVSGSGAGYEQLQVDGPCSWAFMKVRFMNGSTAGTSVALAAADQSLGSGHVPQMAPHVVFTPDGFWQAAIYEGTPDASVDYTGDSGDLYGTSDRGLAPHDGHVDVWCGFAIDDLGYCRLILPNGDVKITRDARYLSLGGAYPFIEIDVTSAATDAKPEILDWIAGSKYEVLGSMHPERGFASEIGRQMLRPYITGGEAQAFFQLLDADLTAIAALDSSTAGMIASDGAGWIKKTYAQVKTALAIAMADVSGLVAALAAKVADPGGANDDIMQRKSGGWTFRTPTQLKADLLGLSWTFLSAVQFVAGSATAAAIRFTSTVGTGLWGTATTVGVTISGTTRAVFNSSGLTLTGSLTPTGAVNAGLGQAGSTLNLSSTSPQVIEIIDPNAVITLQQTSWGRTSSPVIRIRDPQGIVVGAVIRAFDDTLGTFNDINASDGPNGIWSDLSGIWGDGPGGTEYALTAGHEYEIMNLKTDPAVSGAVGGYTIKDLGPIF